MKAIGHKRPREDLNHKYIWHLRLGHIGEEMFNKLEKDEIFDSLNSESYPVYEFCLLQKITKLSFMGHGKRTTELLAPVHIDVYELFDM